MDDHLEPLQLSTSVARLPCQVRNFPSIKNTMESFLNLLTGTLSEIVLTHSQTRILGLGVYCYKKNREYLSIMQQMIVAWHIRGVEKRHVYSCHESEGVNTAHIFWHIIEITYLHFIYMKTIFLILFSDCDFLTWMGCGMKLCSNQWILWNLIWEVWRTDIIKTGLCHNECMWVMPSIRNNISFS